jgi:ABC-type sugar transport system ATPase subunit
MEKARLIVKNFGPLKDIDIEVREMVCLIGKQATGKSTLAKLLAIFECKDVRKKGAKEFKNKLKEFNIYSFLNESTYLNYQTQSNDLFFEIELKDKKIFFNSEYTKNIKNTIQVLNDFKDRKVDNDYLKNKLFFIKFLKQVVNFLNFGFLFLTFDFLIKKIKKFLSLILKFSMQILSNNKLKVDDCIQKWCFKVQICL